MKAEVVIKVNDEVVAADDLSANADEVSATDAASAAVDDVSIVVDETEVSFQDFVRVFARLRPVHRIDSKNKMNTREDKIKCENFCKQK